MGGGAHFAAPTVAAVRLAPVRRIHCRRRAADDAADPARRASCPVRQRVPRLRGDRARCLRVPIDVACGLARCLALPPGIHRRDDAGDPALPLVSLAGPSRRLGIGALLPRDIHLGPLTTHATEMSSPGSSVADLVSMAPHLPWALALLCWTMVVALRLRHRRDQRLVASGVLAVVGLQLIYPQLALLALVTIAGWALLRHQPRAVAFVVPAALVQLPYLAYLLWVWVTTPDALRVVRTSLDVGDPFGFLVLSHLVASGLIVIALASRRLRGDCVLPALWIVGMTVFMFVPGISGTLGRSFMASSVPFGLCAAPGLLVVLRRLRDVAWRRRVLALTLAGSSLYGLVSLAQPYSIAEFRLDPYAEYESRAEAVLLARLAPHVSARDVVLTTYLDGIFVPAQTDARAFNGHPEMTIDARRKSDAALAFFSTWGVAQRATFLHAYGITYVLTTDPALAARLAPDPALEMIDLQETAALFRVRP